MKKKSAENEKQAATIEYLFTVIWFQNDLFNAFLLPYTGTKSREKP